MFNKLAGLVDVDTLETGAALPRGAGRHDQAAKAVKADGARLETAAGKNLKVKIAKGKVTLSTRTPTPRTPRSSSADLNKGNKQIAHGIDVVLRPADL